MGTGLVRNGTWVWVVVCRCEYIVEWSWCSRQSRGGSRYTTVHDVVCLRVWIVWRYGAGLVGHGSAVWDEICWNLLGWVTSGQIRSGLACACVDGWIYICLCERWEWSATTEIVARRACSAVRKYCNSLTMNVYELPITFALRGRQRDMQAKVESVCVCVCIFVCSYVFMLKGCISAKATLLI